METEIINDLEISLKKVLESLEERFKKLSPETEISIL